MGRPRVYISNPLRRQLLLEAGHKCSMPRCAHETGLEIHHIDGDPSNNHSENLLLLCAVHHSLATTRNVDELTCRAIKGLLRNETTRGKRDAIELGTRRKLVAAAIDLLENSNRTYRSQIVGPLFLHPEWYVKRRNERVQLPDFDSAFREYLFRECRERNQDIRLILTNVPRYREKVDGYVLPRERRRFQSGVIDNIERLWGHNAERGPDLCCVNTGFIHIDMIFDNAALSTYRSSPRSPVGGGTLFFYREIIEQTVHRFDTVFDTSTRGQTIEVEALKEFVVSLWK